MKIYFLFLVLSTLRPILSFADEDCPEIQLDQGGSMSHVPVTYQGEVGICYAHAAAQIVDAYRFSHGDTDWAHQTSPLEVAVGSTYSSSPSDDYTDGAYTVCPSVQYVQDSGSCDSSWVDELYSAPGEIRLDFVKAMSGLEQQFQKYSAGLDSSTPTEQVIQGFLPQADAGLQSLLKLESDPQESALPDATGLATDLNQGNDTSVTYHLLEPYCAKRPRVSVPAGMQCHESSTMTAPQIYAAIHQLLALPNAQPIAIKICRNIFESGHTYVGVQADGSPSDDCMLHFPLIMGQKKIDGQCRFLVRNSFGTDDTGYSTDWLPRDNGNLWIDEQTLIQNTFAMTVLGDISETSVVIH